VPIDVVTVCQVANAEHAKSRRQYAHVFHKPGQICVADAFLDLPIEIRLGILLHELGHLALGNRGTETDADHMAREISGIEVYREDSEHGKRLETISERDIPKARIFVEGELMAKTNKKKRRRNPYFNVGGRIVKAGNYKAAVRKTLKQQRNVGGFIDASGEFHPIRDSKGYSAKKAGERAARHRGHRPTGPLSKRNRAKANRRQRNVKGNTTPKMRGNAPKNRWIKAKAVKISRGKIYIKR